MLFDLEDYVNLGIIGPNYKHPKLINWSEAYFTFMSTRDAYLKSVNEQFLAAQVMSTPVELQALKVKHVAFLDANVDFGPKYREFWNAMVSLPLVGVEGFTEGTKFNVNQVGKNEQNPNYIEYPAARPTDTWWMDNYRNVAVIDTNGPYTYTELTADIIVEHKYSFASFMTTVKDILVTAEGKPENLTDWVVPDVMPFETYPELTGYVRGTNSLPIKDAIVRLVDADGVSHEVITDDKGYYKFSNEYVYNNVALTATGATNSFIDGSFNMLLLDHKSGSTVSLYNKTSKFENSFFGAENNRSMTWPVYVKMGRNNRRNFKIEFIPNYSNFPSFSGYVKDVAGNPITDALVVIKDPNSGYSIGQYRKPNGDDAWNYKYNDFGVDRTILTDENGFYEYTSQMVGEWFNKHGFVEYNMPTTILSEPTRTFGSMNRWFMSNEFIVYLIPYKQDANSTSMNLGDGTAIYNNNDYAASRFEYALNQYEQFYWRDIEMGQNNVFNVDVVPAVGNEVMADKIKMTCTPGSRNIGGEIQSTSNYCKFVFSNGYSTIVNSSFGIDNSDYDYDTEFYVYSCDSEGRALGYITKLFIYDTEFSNVSNVDFSETEHLAKITIYGLHASELDLSGLKKLNNLNLLESHYLESVIGLQDSKYLSRLDLQNTNRLTNFTLENLDWLSEVNVIGTALSSFDISTCGKKANPGGATPDGSMDVSLSGMEDLQSINFGFVGHKPYSESTGSYINISLYNCKKLLVDDVDLLLQQLADSGKRVNLHTDKARSSDSDVAYDTLININSFFSFGSEYFESNELKKSVVMYVDPSFGPDSNNSQKTISLNGNVSTTTGYFRLNAWFDNGNPQNYNLYNGQFDRTINVEFDDTFESRPIEIYSTDASGRPTGSITGIDFNNNNNNDFKNIVDIDLTQATELTSLIIKKSGLTSLDLTLNVMLDNLSIIESGKIETIYVGGLVSLNLLNLETMGSITTIDGVETLTGLRYIDISDCPELDFVSLSTFTSLIEINISNVFKYDSTHVDTMLSELNANSTATLAELDVKQTEINVKYDEKKSLLGIDSSFAYGSGFDGGDVLSIAIQSGKIVVGGEFTSYNGTSADRIIRLNSDGSIDTSFVYGTGFDGDIYSIVIQNDSKVLVGGQFATYNGTPANRIIRLNSDGSIDTSFVIGTGFDSDVDSIVIQSDGKILVGGSFTDYNGTPANYIIRLNSDGSVDTSFVYGTGFNGYAKSVAIQSDGKIVVGGQFQSYNGTSANYIIRLTGILGSDEEIAVINEEIVVLEGIITTIQSLINNSGRQVNTYYMARTSASDADYDSLIAFGWNLYLGETFFAPYTLPVKGYITLDWEGNDQRYMYFTNLITSTGYYTFKDGSGNIYSNSGNSFQFYAYKGVLEFWSTDQFGRAGGDFTELGFNQLTFAISVDFDNLTSLTNLSVRDTQITTIDVSNLTNLRWFGCHFNSKITSITGLNLLDKLVSFGLVNCTKLTNVDTSGLESLRTLILDGNSSLSDIDISTIGSKEITGLHFDNTFETNSMSFPHEHIVELPDGKFMVSGFSNIIARLNADGTIDETFTNITLDSTTNGNTYIYAMEVQADGKVLVGGEFDVIGGVAMSTIARINTDGTIDETFTASSLLSGCAWDGTSYVGSKTMNTIKVQPDAKILIGGFFTVLSVNMYGLVRLNSDGTIDSTFVNGLSLPVGDFNGFARLGGAYEDPRVIELQSDGKILVGGSQWNGWFLENSIDSDGVQITKPIYRLNSDGTLDTTFDPNNSLSAAFYDNNNYSYVNSIAVDSTGKIVVGGWFNKFGNLTVSNLIRLNSDGTLDHDFMTAVDEFGITRSFTTNRINRKSLLFIDGKLFVGAYGRSYIFDENDNISEFINTTGSQEYNQITGAIFTSTNKLIIVGNFSGNILTWPTEVFVGNNLNGIAAFDYETYNFKSLRTLRIYYQSFETPKFLDVHENIVEIDYNYFRTFTSADLDTLLAELDANGQSNGQLAVGYVARTEASDIATNNLLNNKGWSLELGSYFIGPNEAPAKGYIHFEDTTVNESINFYLNSETNYFMVKYPNGTAETRNSGHTYYEFNSSIPAEERIIEVYGTDQFGRPTDSITNITELNECSSVEFSALKKLRSVGLDQNNRITTLNLDDVVSLQSVFTNNCPLLETISIVGCTASKRDSYMNSCPLLDIDAFLIQLDETGSLLHEYGATLYADQDHGIGFTPARTHASDAAVESLLNKGFELRVVEPAGDTLTFRVVNSWNNKDLRIGTNTGYFKIVFPVGSQLRDQYPNGVIHNIRQNNMPRKFNSGVLNEVSNDIDYAPIDPGRLNDYATNVRFWEYDMPTAMNIEIYSCSEYGVPSGDITLLFIGGGLTPLTTMSKVIALQLNPDYGVSWNGTTYTNYSNAYSNISFTGMTSLKYFGLYRTQQPLNWIGANYPSTFNVNLTGSDVKYLSLYSEFSTSKNINLVGVTKSSLVSLNYSGFNMGNLDSSYSSLTYLRATRTQLGLCNLASTPLKKINIHELGESGNNGNLSSLQLPSTLVDAYFGLDHSGLRGNLDLSGLTNLVKLNIYGYNEQSDDNGSSANVLGFSSLQSLDEIRLNNVSTSNLNLSGLPITWIDFAYVNQYRSSFTTGFSNLSPNLRYVSLQNMPTLSGDLSFDIRVTDPYPSGFNMENCNQVTSLTFTRVLGCAWISRNNLLSTITFGTEGGNFVGYDYNISNNKILSSVVNARTTNLQLRENLSSAWNGNGWSYVCLLDGAPFDAIMQTLSDTGRYSGYFYSSGVKRTHNSDSAKATLLSRSWSVYRDGGSEFV